MVSLLTLILTKMLDDEVYLNQTHLQAMKGQLKIAIAQFVEDFVSNRMNDVHHSRSNFLSFYSINLQKSTKL